MPSFFDLAPGKIGILKDDLYTQDGSYAGSINSLYGTNNLQTPMPKSYIAHKGDRLKITNIEIPSHPRYETYGDTLHVHTTTVAQDVKCGDETLIYSTPEMNLVTFVTENGYELTIPANKFLNIVTAVVDDTPSAKVLYGQK